MLYSALLNEVLPEVPGCPDITVQRAIRDSFVEFCDSTLCYTVDQDPQPIYAGLDVVDLEIPTGTRLVQLLRAQIGAVPLERISRDELYALHKNWKTDRGRPVAITSETDTSVRLLPTADEPISESLYLRFAVTPTRASTSIPDEIGERFYREIVAGAKSMLMLMPGKDWSNQQMGVAQRALFERGIREAKLTYSQDRVASRKQVRLRRVV
jgi:hypothetical protein